MIKSKGINPILFMTCLMFGIAIFLVYSFAATITIIESDSIDKISHLYKSTRNSTIADNHINTAEQSAFLAETSSNDLYVTSRGDLDRYINNNMVSRIEINPSAPASVKPAAPAVPVPVAAPTPATVVDSAPAPAPEAAVKPAPEAVVTPAPPAPAKPAAAPVKAAAAPAAAPKAVQSAPVKAASGYEYDLDLLARLITAEAQGEPYEAQVAVGAVVMNRVKSSDWPNTIKGVIYQNIGGYYQFTPVVNGWIDKPAEPDCIKAAKEAMSGTDPTGGAQFYYDDKVTNQWILAKPVSTQYGHMIFAF